MLGLLAVPGVDGAASLAAAPAPLANADVRFAAPTAVRLASTSEDDFIVVGSGRFAPIAQADVLFPSQGDNVRSLIMMSAAANNIPYDFFFRLLHQESGLNPHAISPAGALGIAQFMPGTASERGLRNPFDPGEAIPKSAELLREHQARFGNIGLAAAAYNAGPRRVLDWLNGRSGMPAETRDYVLRITGRAIETWAPAGRPVLGNLLPAFYATQGESLFLPPSTPVIRRSGPISAATEAIVPNSRRLRPSKKLDKMAKSVRAEQALCAALNSGGQSCLIQAVY